MEKGRIGVFDGLKGIAIIGIFGIHVGINHGYFTGTAYDIFIYGNRGVEICYIINAILLADSYYKYYSETKYPVKLFKRNLLNLIPIFYLYVLALLIINLSLNEPISKGATLSTMLFINVFRSSWASAFGGSLFFSCLVVTWFFYFIYIKYVNNLNKSIIIGLIMETLFIRYIPHISYQIIPAGEYANYSYLFRCISAFILGHMIYNILVSETFKSVVIPKSGQYFITCFLWFILFRDIIENTLATEKLFLIIGLLIMVNYKSSSFLVDNTVFCYLGKRITPIFSWHIIIYTALDKCAAFINLSIGNKWFICVVISTLILSEITYQIDNKRKKWIKNKNWY